MVKKAQNFKKYVNDDEWKTFETWAHACNKDDKQLKVETTKRTKICDADERKWKQISTSDVFADLSVFVMMKRQSFSIFCHSILQGKEIMTVFTHPFEDPESKLRPFLFTFFSDKSRYSSLFLRLQSPLHYKSTIRRDLREKSTSNPSRDMLYGFDPN